jgi:O-antigen/teichoic acid export membrane protein
VSAEAPSSDHDLLDSPQAGPRIIRGGVLRAAAYVVVSLLSVASAAVLTRYLGTNDFGRYATVFSLMTVVQGVTDAGTMNLGIREHALHDRAAGRRFLGDLLGFRLLLTTVGAGVALVFSLAAGYDAQMVLGTALSGAGLLLLVIASTLAIPLQSGLFLGRVAALDVLRQAFTTVGLIALVIASAGIAALLAINIPVGIALAVATALVAQRRAPLRPTASREAWLRVLRLTLPFAVATAVGVLYAHITIILMSLVATETETGLFGAAFRVYYVLAAIPGLVVGGALPLLARAARDDRQRLSYATQRLLEICLISGVGIAVITSVGAPAIIYVVAGNKFDDAVPVLRLQALALIGTFVIALGAYALLAMHRYRQLLIANGAGLVLTAALVLILAPSHGAEGAATAVVIGDILLGASGLLFVMQGPAGLRLRFRVLPRVVLSGAVAGGVAVLSGLPAVPAAVLAAAAYLAAILVVRAVPPEIFDAVVAWRTRHH